MLTNALFLLHAITLDELERRALERNPTLLQARASIDAAAGRELQAGLLPNPSIGSNGEHVAQVTNGGAVGGFISQRFVLGNKLALGKAVARQEKSQAEQAAAAQRLRVLTSVRTLFYQAVGEQRLLDTRTELAQYAARAAAIARELANVGLVDRPDVLNAEIEQQRLELSLTTTRNALDRTWRQLAAVAGDPALKPSVLEASFEDLPTVDAEAALAKIKNESPELRAAQVGIARAEAAERRARAERIPDLQVRAGLRQNGEWAELPPPAAIRRVGLEGIFDVGIEIPIFNRNQGNIAAARADITRARHEVRRLELSYQSRLAGVVREFADARAMAERYRKEMIPRAEEAYKLYLANYRQMSAPYPQVLMTQRNLIQLREDYLAALIQAWRSAVEVEGLLLTGALEENAAPLTMGTTMTAPPAAGGGGH